MRGARVSCVFARAAAGRFREARRERRAGGGFDAFALCGNRPQKVERLAIFAAAQTV
jgi:hypothetical protein